MNVAKARAKVAVKAVVTAAATATAKENLVQVNQVKQVQQANKVAAVKRVRGIGENIRNTIVVTNAAAAAAVDVVIVHVSFPAMENNTPMLKFILPSLWVSWATKFASRKITQ